MGSDYFEVNRFGKKGCGLFIEIRLLLYGGLCGGKQCGGHTIGRTADIVQSYLMAKGDGGGIAAMLSANAIVQVFTGRAALFDCDLDQLSHAGLVDAYERIFVEYAIVDVIRQKASCVITAQTKRSLRQVVGSKREEIGFFGNFISCERGSWQLNHCAD